MCVLSCALALFSFCRHASEVSGYEAFNNGFDVSWATQGVRQNPLININGAYTRLRGFSEDLLMDQLLGFMGNASAAGEPFLAYYTPRTIHMCVGCVLVCSSMCCMLSHCGYALAFLKAHLGHRYIIANAHAVMMH